MIQLDKYRLSLVSALLATTVLGACGSSGGDDDSPPNDGGATTGTGGAGTDGSDTGSGEGGDTGDTGDTGDIGDAGDAGDAGDTGGGTGGALGSVSGRGATRFGFVQIEQPPAGGGPFGEDEGSVSAAFVRFGIELPVEQAAAQILPPLDTCSVSSVGGDAGGVPVGGDTPGIDIEFLSAGETITLTSPAGTWLTLPRIEQFGFVLYENENPLPLPVPGGLVLDIPGDRFPAFASVAVPDVTPLTGLSPAPDASAAIGADTVFRWNAGNGDPSVFVDISLTAFDVGEDALSITSVDCLVRDDGEFALPASTRADLGDDFSGLATVSRIGVRAEISGDALLLVTSSSSTD